VAEKDHLWVRGKHLRSRFIHHLRRAAHVAADDDARVVRCRPTGTAGSHTDARFGHGAEVRGRS
jgi:hypothetical protein